MPVEGQALDHRLNHLEWSEEVLGRRNWSGLSIQLKPLKEKQIVSKWLISFAILKRIVSL